MWLTGPDYAATMSDTTTSPAASDRGPGRRELTDTRGTILEAARNVLLQDGYAKLSTRRVAELADVPLSQIHYHFGSKQQLILGVLRAENARLLERQTSMYAGPEPLWKQWERACEYLEIDLESGTSGSSRRWSPPAGRTPRSPRRSGRCWVAGSSS